MVRVYAPMLSMDASGTIADAVTFSKWKGRNYVRERVIPHNPKSSAQTGMRAMFTFLAQAWNALTSGNKATWDDLASYSAISSFNAQTSHNMSRFRDFKAPTKAYPATATATLPTLGTLTAVAGERSVTVTQNVTAEADAWGIMFFRSPTGTFDPTWDNLVAVKKTDGTNAVIFIDSPLPPGTYYYDTIAFTDDGKKGTPTGEQSATIS